MPGWIIGASVAVGATVLIAQWLTSANRKLRKEIRAVPQVPLSSATEHEPIRISGELQYIDADNTLTAPMSGRPCAAWHFIVWRLEGGKNKTWRKKLEESDSQSFLLKDGDKLAYVDGTAIELLLTPDAKEENRFLSVSPPHVDEFLTSRGLETHGMLFRHSYRVYEGILEEGERVTAVGVGQWEQDPTRRGQGYRDVGRRFHLSELPDGRILASDEAKLTAE